MGVYDLKGFITSTAIKEIAILGRKSIDLIIKPEESYLNKSVLLDDNFQPYCETLSIISKMRE